MKKKNGDVQEGIPKANPVVRSGGSIKAVGPRRLSEVIFPYLAQDGGHGGKGERRMRGIWSVISGERDSDFRIRGHGGHDGGHAPERRSVPS